jgi:hypothetical protein
LPKPKGSTHGCFTLCLLPSAFCLIALGTLLKPVGLCLYAQQIYKTYQAKDIIMLLHKTHLHNPLHLHKQWKVAPALMVTLGITATAFAPLTFSSSATATPAPTTIAQLFPPQNNPYGNYGNTSYSSIAIPPGARIPVRYNGADKIIVAPNETLPLTLTVSRNIRSSSGALLIPAGSQVRGRVEPVRDGSQFVADSLTLTNGNRLPIDAFSNVITRRQEVVPGVNGDALLKGSAIGAGAATLLSGVLGNRRITVGKVLAGAGAGALSGLLLGKKRAEVMVIDADSDLNLTLNSRLVLNSTY